MVSFRTALTLFHVDREGQNGVRQFPVMPDSEQFLKDLYKVKQIIKSRPSILPPKLNINENKTCDDSIKLGMPWQCNRCNYLDVSCRGALPSDKREIKGIVARKKDDGDVYPDDDKYEGLIPIIKEVI